MRIRFKYGKTSGAEEAYVHAGLSLGTRCSIAPWGHKMKFWNLYLTGGYTDDQSTRLQLRKLGFVLDFSGQPTMIPETGS